MARYRKVDSRIWNDEKFTSLSDDGQLVFLLLLTHPHQTALGAMRATVSGLAEEKGWLPQRLSEAFGEALSKGMVRRDEKASCIWLPNFLKYNRPESPNVVRAWGSAADLIPECALKIECIQVSKDFLKGFKEGFKEAFAEVFGKALPKDYALSGAGAGAGAGAVFKNGDKCAENKSELSNASQEKFPPLTLEQCQQLQSAYPPGIYRQSEWLVVQKLVNQHLANGVAFERILASFERSAAQCRAREIVGTQFVLSPVKHCDLNRPLFDEPFPLPKTKAEIRQDANADAGDTWLARQESQNATG